MHAARSHYLLGELEARGYIERRPEKGRRAVLIHLTRRGWRFFETQWAAMKQLEDESAEVIGKKRFEECLDTLRRLSALDVAAAGAAGEMRLPQSEAGAGMIVPHFLQVRNSSES